MASPSHVSSSSAGVLLGTPYILSQSSSHPASTTTTAITPSVCENLTQFKRILAASRSLDDLITTRLNRENALARSTPPPTTTTRGTGLGGECERVWRELLERWDERNQVLTYCDRALAPPPSSPRDAITREEVGLSAEKGQLGRGRSTESELKRQQLHFEFSVERIIRQRTLNLLASRCPSLSLASAPSSTIANSDATAVVSVPRAIGEESEEEERKRRRGRDERGTVRWA